jgi:hypothetical protein
MSEENDRNPAGVSAKLLHAYDLIFALCMDRITDAEAVELESLVRSDPEICDFYIDIMHLKSSLHRYAFYFTPPMGSDLTDEVQTGTGSGEMNESMVLPALPDLADDQAEDAGERFQPAPASLNISRASDSRGLSPTVKRGIAALILLTAGVVGYLVLSKRGSAPVNNTINPQGPVAVESQPAALPEPVATLNFTQKPVWAPAFSPPLDGKFYPNQVLSLDAGDVQLSLQSGGRVVIEGPAEIQFEAVDRIALHSGKIAATIPGGGLVVDCPDGSIKDLGTQFGVDVHTGAATEVAVFQGRVSASLNSTATTQGTRELVLTAGQAAAMSPNKLTADEKGAVPQHFVRSLVNTDVRSLDLTDLICGGDGTTRKRGLGIDPSTGAAGQLKPTFALTSDGKYHPVRGYPFVDGAFIADTGRDSMIVDSAGDSFHFPGLGATAYNYIFTGGKIPWPESPQISPVMNGVDYSTPDHATICIHPNNGLTVDLSAVRRIYPDLMLKDFHCRVGISGAAGRKDPKIPDAAVLVLIDGSQRFRNPHFTIFDGTFDISIPLGDKDRFMTLASTYAGPGNYRNWVLWVDAKLDLSAAR